jgi:hypothetical protein
LQTSAIIDELPVVKGSKRSLFEANLEDVPIDIIEDSQTAQKRNKIDEHTSVLLLVDSPPGASPSTSHLTETWRLGSASTITELRNSDCGQNSSFLSVCHDIDKFDLRTVLEEDVLGRAILSKHVRNLPITNRDRNSLCEIIVTHFLNKSCKLNNDLLSRIADQIVSIIPTEKKTTYFISPIKKRLSRLHKPEVAKGKLVDKHRNKLTALRRIIEFTPDDAPTEQTIDGDDIDTSS